MRMGGGESACRSMSGREDVARQGERKWYNVSVNLKGETEAGNRRSK